MTVFAYIRVSRDEQTTENQKLQITQQGFGVDEWISDDGVSGKVLALQRPSFAALMKKVKEGDTICTVALDRLGRNTEDILSTIRVCRERGVKLRVMALDGTDLTSKSGKILVTLMALIAEIERDDISTRTKAGLARTKSEGMLLGRPLRIPPVTLKALCKGRKEKRSLDSLSAEYGVDRTTINQAVKRWEGSIPAYEERWEKQEKQAAQKAMENAF